MYQLANTAWEDKEANSVNTKAAVASALTSHIPARLLPGNGTSENLRRRGKEGDETLRVEKIKRSTESDWSR